MDGSLGLKQALEKPSDKEKEKPLSRTIKEAADKAHAAETAFHQAALHLDKLTCKVEEAEKKCEEVAIERQKASEELDYAHSLQKRANEAECDQNSPGILNIKLLVVEGLTGFGILHQIGLGSLVDGYTACRTQYLPFCF